MSSSMPIPARKQPAAIAEAAGSASSSSPSSSYGSSRRTPSLSSRSPAAWKGKSKVPITPQNNSSSSSSGMLATSPPPSSLSGSISRRRPSLMGTSLSKSEYTVINLGHEDGPPRLVTCVKSSQGFDWNQELFLPSYVASEYADEDLEHRPDPVEDIVLTDEEAEALMPR
ncbi:hypothetical protein Slin15195_G094590 [Septoria linicola]|uniref:Uncharacterized protein n=1 Tax=Septoria linicola TaxID=215465 RepID=A0A9Q9B0X0_9PEZI|nr:hypothetical protein Slin15195_G094590 [Septoria linicola]